MGGRFDFFEKQAGGKNVHKLHVFRGIFDVFFGSFFADLLSICEKLTVKKCEFFRLELLVFTLIYLEGFQGNFEIRIGDSQSRISHRVTEA